MREFVFNTYPSFYHTTVSAGRYMALVPGKQASRGEENGGEGIITIPGMSPDIEKWLLEYRSPKHRMSAPPPVQQVISADVALAENHKDLYQYHETLTRANMSTEKTLAVSYKYFCKWMDIIFNYKEHDTTLSERNKGFPNSRMLEVAIGNCRITTLKELELNESRPGRVHGPMKSYARVGIPAAVIQAIKVCLRRATSLPDVDFLGPEEINNGLRWMRVGFAREGVHFLRVTRERAQNAFSPKYCRASDFTALEIKRAEVPCVLFLTVRVSCVWQSTPPIQLIHFLLVECHHMDGAMFI